MRTPHVPVQLTVRRIRVRDHRPVLGIGRDIAHEAVGERLGCASIHAHAEPPRLGTQQRRDARGRVQRVPVLGVPVLAHGTVTRAVHVGDDQRVVPDAHHRERRRTAHAHRVEPHGVRAGGHGARTFGVERDLQLTRDNVAVPHRHQADRARSIDGQDALGDLAQGPVTTDDDDPLDLVPKLRGQLGGVTDVLGRRGPRGPARLLEVNDRRGQGALGSATACDGIVDDGDGGHGPAESCADARRASPESQRTFNSGVK